MVRVTVHPVAVEDVGDGLDATIAMAGEAKHAKLEEDIQKLHAPRRSVGEHGSQS